MNVYKEKEKLFILRTPRLKPNYFIIISHSFHSAISAHLIIKVSLLGALMYVPDPIARVNGFTTSLSQANDGSFHERCSHITLLLLYKSVFFFYKTLCRDNEIIYFSIILFRTINNFSMNFNS